MTPLLSVLIPAYNHQDYITDTIRSVWAQGVSECEIIVIDDGSSDRTYERAMALAGASPIPMRVLTRPNKGLVPTLNELVSLSRGTFLLFIASDDGLIRGSIPRILDLLTQDPELQIVYANARYWHDGKAIGDPVYGSDFVSTLSSSPAVVLEYLYTRVPILLTQASIVRRSFVHQIGGFDESVALDDWPYHIKVFRALTQAGRHTFLGIDMSLYRVHSANMSKGIERQLVQITETANKYIPERHRSAILAGATYRLAFAAILKKPSLSFRLLCQSFRYEFSWRRLILLPVALARRIVAGARSFARRKFAAANR
jgi:glycosyltransferase involved in cell wall biosynthesis